MNKMFFVAILSMFGCVTRNNNDSTTNVARTPPDPYNAAPLEADEKIESPGKPTEFVKRLNASAGRAGLELRYSFKESNVNKVRKVEVKLLVISLFGEPNYSAEFVDVTNNCRQISDTTGTTPTSDVYHFTPRDMIGTGQLSMSEASNAPIVIYQKHNRDSETKCYQHISVKTKAGWLYDQLSGLPGFTIKL